MNEIDIPCSDCDTPLLEHTVHTRDLAVITRWQGEVVIAECLSCGARYFPKETLRKLSESATDANARGES